LQSKTEHIFCVEYKILGFSVIVATAVEGCANDDFGCKVNPLPPVFEYSLTL
jgi:hypothetical protein